MSNLVKSGYVSVTSTDTVTIDTNEIFKKRLEALKSARLIPEDELLCNDEAAEDADGFVAGLDPIQVEALVSDTEPAPAFNEAAMEQASLEADHIINEAREVAEQIKKQAYDEGYKNGLSEGRAAAEGTISQEKERLKKDFEIKEANMRARYENELTEMEPMLIGKLTEIYEHILGVSLSDSTGIVLFLLKKALSTMDSNRNYVIHVSKDDFDFVKDSTDSISKVCGILPDNIEVIEDHSLLKNGCMIETDGGIFDVGLDTQLSLLKKQLLILSMEN